MATSGAAGWPVGLEDLGRLGERVEQLDRRARRCCGRRWSAARRRARSRAAPRPRPGAARPPASATRAVGPSRYGVAVVADRLERVRPRDLVLGEGIAPVRRVEVEPVARDDATVVHRVLVGVAQADEPRLARVGRWRERGRPAHRLLRVRDGVRAARVESRRARAVRGAREKPPTRTLTGWIGRPPRMATIRLPSRLSRRPRSTTSGWSAGQLDRARVARGSRARAAGRCAVRGSRSTRRSRRGGAGAEPPGRCRRRRGRSKAWTADIW